MQRRDPAGIETGAIDSLVELDGARVLEVGCGDGRLTTFAADRAALVYAFDPNGERVEEARSSLTAEQARSVRFGVHAVEALDVGRERFDVALCGWSL
jgi:2-polyprenyl-3-methyl-5-hydroxy-6-metoxy-1,4-benzoquinol methylase